MFKATALRQSGQSLVKASRGLQALPLLSASFPELYPRCSSHLPGPTQCRSLVLLSLNTPDHTAGTPNPSSALPPTLACMLVISLGAHALLEKQLIYDFFF